MGTIQDIKKQFGTPEVYHVFSDCMHMPTWDKFNSRSVEYITNHQIHIFGYYEDNRIVGMIVINQQGELSEIKGIAVDVQYRKRGIGKKLIQYGYDKLSLSASLAETDDEAVEFYRHCGFEIKEFMRNSDNGVYKRYRCILHAKHFHS